MTIEHTFVLDAMWISKIKEKIMKNAGLAIGMFMTWLIMTGFIGLGINALFDGIIPLVIMWIFVVSTGVLWLFVFCVLVYEDKK